MDGGYGTAAKQGSLFSREMQEALQGAADDDGTEWAPDLGSYDRIILCTSGGRDSTAAFLQLKKLGVDRSKLELHHHHIDGREGSDLFDWPCTPSYVDRFGAAFGVEVTSSWRQGGIEGEMMREDALTRAIGMRGRGGALAVVGGTRGKIKTRRRQPAVGAIADGRWCSPIGKIDPFRCYLCHGGAPKGARTLVVTGERAEESQTRRNLTAFAPHKADARDSRKLARHIDAWMPVHAWSRHRVWRTIREAGVVPHPCYYLGIGRCSCAYCVFAPPSQLATLRLIDPERFGRHERLERSLQHTVNQAETLGQRASRGRPYPWATPERVAAAMSREYVGPILVDPADWEEPAGAFADAAGPT